MSADGKGGIWVGRWTVSEDGAILNLGFVTPGNPGGELEIRRRFMDDDTMRVIVVLPGPIVIKMIRLDEQDGKNGERRQRRGRLEEGGGGKPTDLDGQGGVDQRAGRGARTRSTMVSMAWF